MTRMLRSFLIFLCAMVKLPLWRSGGDALSLASALRTSTSKACINGWSPLSSQTCRLQTRFFSSPGFSQCWARRASARQSQRKRARTPKSQKRTKMRMNRKIRRKRMKKRRMKTWGRPKRAKTMRRKMMKSRMRKTMKHPRGAGAGAGAVDGVAGAVVRVPSPSQRRKEADVVEKARSQRLVICSCFVD
ncbi:unnamed protein product [Symbiodinium sp. CCMP2456]|nr:unnamed protein product [Symbiodinium sp. CCMP2456]